MSRLEAVIRLTRFVVLAAAVLCAQGCRKLEPRALDPVRALRSRVQPRFRPPEDGVLTVAQLEAYVTVRRGARGRPESEAASAMGVEPAEVVWVRARVAEALLALDAKRVTDTALDSYANAIVLLRETRRTARDPKAAARIDAEIAGLERERSSLRRRDKLAPATLKNASLVAGRRAEMEAAGP